MTNTTTSDYAISIPINACYSLFLCGLPSGLSKEEILSKLDVDTLLKNGAVSNPESEKDAVWEAQYTLDNDVDSIDVEEQPDV